MSGIRVWRALLGVEHAVIERVQIDDDPRPGGHHGTAAEVRVLGQATLDAACAAHPHRFGHRRPEPPKLPVEAWINQPSREALIQSA